MDLEKAHAFADAFWEEKILPALSEYIRIPVLSRAFDPDWEKNGHTDRALALVRDWLEENRPRGARVHVGKIPGRTPVLLVEIPGDSDETVLMYGHLDKQPEMTGWRAGLSAWSPVREGNRLYGRGGADDGYAVFVSVAALRALEEQRVSHARVVVLIEFSEESGSPDLPAYMEDFSRLIGTPGLVIALDSGVSNYEQIWSTSSLRGVVGCALTVEVLREGVHSGDGSGIVPSSFRIAREILSRLEDETTGVVRPEGLRVAIPKARIGEARAAAAALGDEIHSVFPWVSGMRPVSDDPVELLLNRTWRPELEVTGQEGIPRLGNAGNVLRPFTTLKLSLRIPPTLPSSRAEEIVRAVLTSEPPYGARVSCQFDAPAGGWDAPPLAPWLREALDESSETLFGKKAMHLGDGGSIPFIGTLGRKFPEAQFFITGVLGPESNAHGPNEFLEIGYAKKLTAAVSSVLDAHRVNGGRLRG
jgi:acetylornithine deacetylase/succinyl-diaminopimelate desuccinylase-like protein